MNNEIKDLATDPIELFHIWLAEAEKTESVNPGAMALATADESGRPSVRMVLLKGADADGFVFYTNSQSRKGSDLAANPQASLCFYWKSLLREVRVDGAVTKVADATADAYFATRARASQIGAWASDQSRVMDGRFELEKRVAAFTAKFGIGAVPRPPHWEGYSVFPERIEFWQEKSFRLHERFEFIRNGEQWRKQRLFP